MSVSLFSHNRDAYSKVCAMLETTGKAAVIHPTGTGKSFIAFKLIEEHVNASFLWLSPSEYIFETQRTSLHRSNPELLLENVTYMTYTKLMQLSIPIIAELEADYIILDEFHRCGAELWGAGVLRLLKQKPKAKLLGLTATNVRYLDNQRDMAEELFENHIASQMTLGEAIVRGILPAPKYITTVYKWQQELEKYEKRVQALKSAGLRKRNQSYLDALRHALEKADGLPQVFERHITKRDGKYIVFCMGVEHMKEMISHVPEWFGGIDQEPHCYAAFSDNPCSSQAFADFNQDKSDHLKLLFCIDMLNEGIHVNGISGVILFRPTVSPIIYKQQIGRALTSGAEDAPLILDVVNNFENLSSVGAIQEEMDEAVLRFRRSGDTRKIVTERFELLEQARDCRGLFERLERSLGQSWEQCYEAARNYYKEHGNLLVPTGYVTSDGLQLGSWLTTQRRVYSGKMRGRLSDEQVQKLNAIGMRWGDMRDYAWERNMEAARTFIEKNGHLLIPYSYETEDGLRLGHWIQALRQQKKKGTLSKERIQQLNDIGMKWDATEARWEMFYQKAAAYYREHGNLQIPYAYKSEDGAALGAWIRNIQLVQCGKKRGKLLSETQIRRLNQIGMQWENRNDSKWMRNYLAAKNYYEQHGDLNVPRVYRSEEGIALNNWIYEQRRLRRKQEETGREMSPKRVEMLNEIGMIWDRSENEKEYVAVVRMTEEAVGVKG